MEQTSLVINSIIFFKFRFKSFQKKTFVDEFYSTFQRRIKSIIKNFVSTEIVIIGSIFINPVSNFSKKVCPFFYIIGVIRGGSKIISKESATDFFLKSKIFSTFFKLLKIDFLSFPKSLKRSCFGQVF